VFKVLDPKLCSSLYRWKPNPTGSKTGNILVTVAADGYLCYWHATSSKCIFSHKDHNESDLYCLDFNHDASLLACAGKDTFVKIYDETTKSLLTEMKSGGQNMPGHSNRIFCLKFTDSPNVLVSGGWDNTLQIWDLREGMPVGWMYGPHICGDGIDIKGDMIVTSSYRSSDVLELYSLKERKKLKALEWDPGSRAPGGGSYLYSCAFDKRGGDLLLAGGAGRNEAKMYQFQDEIDAKQIGTIANLPRAVTDIDFANTKDLVAFSGGDGCIRMMQLLDDSEIGTSSYDIE
jgi:COMPASS component SWD3